MISATESGIDGVIDDLGRAADTIQRLAAAEVQHVAGKVVATAKANVAVRSGKTRDSIHASGRTGGSGSQGADLGPETLEVEVGPSLKQYYARFLEDGTVRQPPRPFMAPALDAHSLELELRLARVAQQAAS